MKKYLISLFLVFPFFVFAQTFDKDLYFGIQKDSDVTKLQEFLTEQGVYSGPISGNFFSLTLQGVKTFQTTQGISSTSGYFGPKSRAKANLILATQGVSSTGVTDESGSPTPAVTTPPKTTTDTVLALMVQIQLLQQQLNALQTQQQTLQTIQQQQVTQTQTLQQIQTNTAPPPAPPAPSPTPTPTPVHIPVKEIYITATNLRALQAQSRTICPLAHGHRSSSLNINSRSFVAQSVSGSILIQLCPVSILRINRIV